MHRLVTLQVVRAKLHTVPMQTIGRDAAEILWGDTPPGSALSSLNEVIGNTEIELAFKYKCLTVHFSTLACNTQLYIISCSIHHRGTDINFCSYFFWSFLSSVVSNCYASCNHA